MAAVRAARPDGAAARDSEGGVAAHRGPGLADAGLVRRFGKGLSA